MNDLDPDNLDQISNWEIDGDRGPISTCNKNLSKLISRLDEEVLWFAKNQE